MHSYTGVVHIIHRYGNETRKGSHDRIWRHNDQHNCQRSGHHSKHFRYNIPVTAAFGMLTQRCLSRVGVAHRGWSGQIVTWHYIRSLNIVSFFLSFCVSFLTYFLSFLCLFQHATRSHFLTDQNDLYAKTCVSGQRCAFWGFRHYTSTFKDQTPKNIPKVVRNRHFPAKSAKS